MPHAPIGDQPLVDKETACRLLHSTAHDWEWLIGRIESCGGQLCLPTYITATIKILKIESYPRLYENETSIFQILISGLLEERWIDELNRKLAEEKPDVRGALLCDFFASARFTRWSLCHT
jgi:hypothetical protein